MFILRAWDIFLPAFVCLAAIFFVKKYPLTEDRAYEIKALLAERRKETQEQI
jgi:GPH family glycoside/pentoside/hexuronide:cation symporter